MFHDRIEKERRRMSSSSSSSSSSSRRKEGSGIRVRNIQPLPPSPVATAATILQLSDPRYREGRREVEGPSRELRRSTHATTSVADVRYSPTSATGRRTSSRSGCIIAYSIDRARILCLDCRGVGERHHGVDHKSEGNVSWAPNYK